MKEGHEAAMAKESIKARHRRPMLKGPVRTITPVPAITQDLRGRVVRVTANSKRRRRTGLAPVMNRGRLGPAVPATELRKALHRTAKVRLPAHWVVARVIRKDRLLRKMVHSALLRTATRMLRPPAMSRVPRPPQPCLPV